MDSSQRIIKFTCQEEKSILNDKSDSDEDDVVIHPMDRVFVNHKDAKCLDGSQSAFYYHEGDSDVLIIYFYMGGICIEDASKFQQYGDHAYIESCEYRKTTFYGSTKDFPEKFNNPQGIMGSSKYQNPFLNRASKIFLMYCDGSLYYNQTNEEIFSALIDQVKLRKRAILAGAGSGGHYLIKQANRFAEILQSKGYQDVKLLLDSILVQLIDGEFKNAYQEVATRLGFQLSDIMSFDLIKQINIPTFFIQSQYDWWIYELMYGFSCIQRINLEKCTGKEKKQIENIRNKERLALTKIVKDKENWGLWNIACVWHDFLIWTEVWNNENHRIPENGLQLSKAFQKWFDETEDDHIHVDLLGWPYNKECSNIPEAKFDETLQRLKDQYEREERQAARDEDL
ncbi:hypothetical protein pb186bvf_015228 [Paramecium bursaria]